MSDILPIEWVFLPTRAALTSFAVATTAAQAVCDEANISHESETHYRYLQVEDKHAIAEVSPDDDGSDGAWIATTDDELVIEAARNR